MTRNIIKVMYLENLKRLIIWIKGVDFKIIEILRVMLYIYFLRIMSGSYSVRLLLALVLVCTGPYAS